MRRISALIAVARERNRQEELWAGPHDHGKGSCASDEVPEPIKAAVLLEEVGEVARALLEGDREGLATELIQVAAVAVAWREALP